MGGATSKVSAENIASQLISAVTTTNAGAITSSQAVNIVNLSGNCVIEAEAEINQFINIKVDSEIIQNIQNKTETQQLLAATVKQISESEAPNLSLSAGADSEAFTKLINNLSTNISSSISANCTQSSTSLNEFNCTDYAIFKGKDNQEILGDYFYKCTQKLENVIKAKQDLQTFIDQHSSAKVEDVIVKILICVAIIMALYFLGPSLGKLLGSFSNSSNNTSSLNNQLLPTSGEQTSKPTVLNKIFLSIFVIIVGVIIYLLFFKN